MIHSDDTAGQERFRLNTGSTFSGADGIFITYNVTGHYSKVMCGSH